MTKKGLILYASQTGNTEKVAGAFKEVFLRHGWECDMFKIDSAIDPENPPFDLPRYDFLCAGSPVIASLPVKEMVRVLSRNPASPHRDNADYWQTSEEASRKRRRFVTLAGEPDRNVSLSPRIRFGPGDKKGIVFVTFGGVHLGPKEAQPALALLESEMEHLRFQCLGKFACPGKMGRAEGWFKDLPNRPNERDLRKAATFLEEVLEDIRD